MALHSMHALWCPTTIIVHSMYPVYVDSPLIAHHPLYQRMQHNVNNNNNTLPPCLVYANDAIYMQC